MVFSSPMEAHANICGHIYTVGASEKHLNGYPVPLENPPPVKTSLTLLELITIAKVGLCPNLRME